MPKFTENDIPLYNGITNDLFPGVVTPTPDYTLLNEKMHTVCSNLNLQPKPEFLKKCIELYETIMVRHGLMVVGGAFSGKSKVIKVLQDAFSSIENDPNFVNVQTFFINPKSIQQTQLYGTSRPHNHDVLLVFEHVLQQILYSNIVDVGYDDLGVGSVLWYDIGRDSLCPR